MHVTSSRYPFTAEDDTGVSLKKMFKNTPLKGVWPLMTPQGEATEFVLFGTKAGYDETSYRAVRKKLGREFKYVFTSRSGPYTKDNASKLRDHFDAVFDMDMAPDHPTSLRCNHAMMARGMPYEGFFWPPQPSPRSFDFGILTWGPSDTTCKRWDRMATVLPSLLDSGLTAIVVSQRDVSSELVSAELQAHVADGSLVVRDHVDSAVEFHKVISDSNVALFPNEQDSFPKHMIEALLSDRRIVVSKDLLFGLSALSEIDSSVVKVLDWSSPTCAEDIRSFLLSAAESSPREAWLRRYDVTSVARDWAAEFNRMFSTDYSGLYYFNHFARLRACGILGAE